MPFDRVQEKITDSVTIFSEKMCQLCRKQTGLCGQTSTVDRIDKNTWIECTEQQWNEKHFRYSQLANWLTSSSADKESFSNDLHVHVHVCSLTYSPSYQNGLSTCIYSCSYILRCVALLVLYMYLHEQSNAHTFSWTFAILHWYKKDGNGPQVTLAQTSDSF